MKAVNAMTRFGVAAALCLVSLAVQANLLTRDLGCEPLAEGRAVLICLAIERELEWTWTGHAIFAPGWRPTAGTVRRVFCGLPVLPEDTLRLVRLRSQPQWRLQSAAESLLRLLGRDAIHELQRAGGGMARLGAQIEIDIAAEESVFNPAHAAYVLKGGCTRR